MTRVNTHLDTHDLRKVHQSEYHIGHSTETAPVKVFNDILCAVDDKQYVLLVLAAYDATDFMVGTLIWHQW